MQDLMYDELRGLADHIDAESIDKLFNEPATPDWDDDEEELRERYRSQLEPKYVIVKHGARYEFRARYVDMHRTLLSSDEIRYGLCDGGGFWGVDGEKMLVTLYDSSSDFGRPKNIEAAIRQDGWHLLEILGRVCDKSGEEHDLSDYKISYIDAIGHRHVVEPPYNVSPKNEISDTSQMLKNYAGAGISASVTIKRPSNYTPPSSVDKKKRKAKRHQQKQSRKRNKR